MPGQRGAAPSTVELTGTTLLDREGVPCSTCRTGDALAVHVSYRAGVPAANQVVEVFFYSGDGRVLHCQLTTAFGAAPFTVTPGPGSVEFTIDELPLQPGDYAVVASTRDALTQQIGSCSEAVRLTVRPGRMVRGYFYLPHAWHHAAGQEVR